MTNKEIQEIYEFIWKIPRGKVTTYGQLGDHFNIEAQDVGQIVRDCLEFDVPVHRVVSADGSLKYGYSRGAVSFWERMLRYEGVAFTEKRKVDLDNARWP